MSHFFAYLARMKFIQRWGLMRNTSTENIQEHSLQVAMIGHGLALIRNRLFNGTLDPQRVATLALFHDVSEVITGDLASPIKYFNPQVKSAFDAIEDVANAKLLDMLPAVLREEYRSLLIAQPDDAACWKLVKAADRICAYLKCVEEVKAGNQEFIKAKKTLENQIHAFDLPEVEYFMVTYVPSFSLTLDELN